MKSFSAMNPRSNSRLRSQPGQRRKPAELRAKILARYQARYADFGPTLAAEYLEKEGLVVDHETLRRWLLAEDKRTVRRRRQRHRQWRERKPCFERWSNWTAPTTTGLKVGGPSVC